MTARQPSTQSKLDGWSTVAISYCAICDEGRPLTKIPDRPCGQSAEANRRILSVPVVPCDEDAVERVAQLLFARSFVPMQTVGRVQDLWDEMDDDRREFLRQAARELFEVAAGA